MFTVLTPDPSRRPVVTDLGVERSGWVAAKLRDEAIEQRASEIHWQRLMQGKRLSRAERERILRENQAWARRHRSANPGRSAGAWLPPPYRGVTNRMDPRMMVTRMGGVGKPLRIGGATYPDVVVFGDPATSKRCQIIQPGARAYPLGPNSRKTVVIYY